MTQSHGKTKHNKILARLPPHTHSYINITTRTTLRATLKTLNLSKRKNSLLDYQHEKKTHIKSIYNSSKAYLSGMKRFRTL